MVEVDDEDAARPFEGDHLVLLVLPAHVAGVGRKPTVLLLGLVQGSVKLVEMFVPERESTGVSIWRTKPDRFRHCLYRRFASSGKLNWRRA